MTHPYFEIHESEVEGQVQLRLEGELDLSSTRVLEDRLTRLRGKRRPVRLDLSELQFIDSTGLHLLIRTFADARTDGWSFEIGPEISSTVNRLFKLVHFDPFRSA